MKLKILGLLCEAGYVQSKLDPHIEDAYAAFERDFKKETGQSVNSASIKTIKNSQSYKKMIDKIQKYDRLETGNTGDYNYADEYDGAFAGRYHNAF